jgi:hypothetical protein
VAAEDAMTSDERRKYHARMLPRYRAADRAGRGALLTEMEQVTGLHRTSLMRRLGRLERDATSPPPCASGTPPPQACDTHPQLRPGIDALRGRCYTSVLRLCQPKRFLLCRSCTVVNAEEATP